MTPVTFFSGTSAYFHHWVKTMNSITNRTAQGKPLERVGRKAYGLYPAARDNGGRAASLREYAGVIQAPVAPQDRCGKPEAPGGRLHGTIRIEPQ